MKIIRPITVSDGGSFSRASAGKYYDKDGLLQSATTDAPRFTYDPATLLPLGLMEESAATNLLLRSEAIDNASWTKTNATISAEYATAPDGNTTADLITTSTATGGISQSVTVTNSTSYVASFYVKAGTFTNYRLSDTVSGVQADYDLTAETATITSGSGVATIQQIGTSGWYRISLKFTSASTTATISLINNSGSAGTFYAWGAQLEAGSTATSYITTTTAAATRAADVNTAGMLSNVTEADYAAYSSTHQYTTGDYVIVVSSGVHKIYKSLQGSTSTVTMTIASPAVVSWTAHGLTAGKTVQFSTTGALPTGVVAGTTYYVISSGLTADAFQISATAGGSAINTSGSQSGVHTAIGGDNLNKTPASNPTYWLDSGNTNRWKMFDQSVQSQTTNTDVIFVAIKAGSVTDSVSLLNFNGQGARIVVNDPVEGTVYDQLIDGVNNDAVSDWYSYFFEEIIYRTDVAVTGIPPYLNATINIMIYNIGATASCGAAVIGLSRDIGDTEVNPRVGIEEYSVKTRDAFGNYTIVQRAYNRRANFTVYVESRTVDYLQTLLASYRATPIVYIGDDEYGACIIYGFYKNFEIDIGYLHTGWSVCSLELEGLV